MPSIPFLTLAEFSQLESHSIGNKAAQIGQLYKLKLPIPESLLIPSKTLKTLLFFNKLEDKFLEQLDNTDWENPHSIKASSQLIQKFIKNIAYPANISQSLISVYHKQFKNNYVAVRLSPLSSSEDSLKNAYLNVKGDANLLDSIISLWSEHFHEFLLKKRYEEIKSGQFAATSILLQRMIQSQSAGIAFTGDIQNLGKNIISIYATWGIADDVEEGLEFDKFLVNFSNQNIILRDIAIKKNQHERKLDTLKIKKVPKNKQAVAAINDKQVLQIAEYVLLAKRKTIDHITLEWANEKGKIFILSITQKYEPKQKKLLTKKDRLADKTNIKVFCKFSKKNEPLFDPNFCDGLAYYLDKLKEVTIDLPKNSKLFILPFVKTIHEFLLLKETLNNSPILREPKLPLLLEFSSPAALLEIETYLKYPIDGFSLNLKSIDLFLRGIDQNQAASLASSSFDTHLMKQILDGFFEKVHTSKKSFHLQIQLEKIDGDFLNYLVQKKIDSLLVKQNQIQYCKTRLFEIEEEQIISN